MGGGGCKKIINSDGGGVVCKNIILVTNGAGVGFYLGSDSDNID